VGQFQQKLQHDDSGHNPKRSDIRRHHQHPHGGLHTIYKSQVGRKWHNLWWGTGIGAFSNTGEADWAGFQIVQVPVPEPSTLMLLGIGTLSFLGRLRKKLLT